MDVKKLFIDDSELFDVCDVTKVKVLSNQFQTCTRSFLSFTKERINKNELYDLVPFDIVQFSNFDDCTIELVKVLYFSGNKGYSYEELGSLLLDSKRKNLALKKYGENHSKTANVLGLTKIVKINKRTQVFLTNLGLYYYSLDDDSRIWLMKFMILRSKYISNLIKKSLIGTFRVYEEVSFLKKSTIKRRLPNLKRLYNELTIGIENEMLFVSDGVDYDES